MTKDKGDQQALIEALQRFTDKADNLLSMNSGNNTSSIQVHAGGFGVWICVICCAVMVTALACGGVAAYAVMGDLKQDVRSLKDGEKAIRAYINTGLLQPKEVEDER